MVIVALNAPPDDCRYGTADATREERFMRTLECLDVQIARLLEGIGPTTLARTTIVFMGDNGTDTGNVDRPVADGTASSRRSRAPLVRPR